MRHAFAFALAATLLLAGCAAVQSTDDHPESAGAGGGHVGSNARTIAAQTLLGHTSAHAGSPGVRRQTVNPVTGGAAATFSSLTVTGTSNLQGDVSDSAGDFTIADNVVVTGTSDLKGNLFNSTALTALTIADDVAITGSADLQGLVHDSTGNLTLGDAVDVSGVLTASSNVTFSGANTFDMQGTLSDSTGDVTIGDTLAVSGITTFTSDVRFASWVEVSGSAWVSMRGKDISDGAGIGVVLDNSNALTTDGDRVVSFRSGGTERAYIDHGGGIRLGIQDQAKPTCNAAHRGTIWYDPGGAGVADTLEVCRKDAADAYAWTSLY